MPALVQQIEAILQRKLTLAPARDGDPLANLMPVKTDTPKYAVDAEGEVIGLNLARMGLKDAVWKDMLDLPGLAEGLQGLNLGGNTLTDLVFTTEWAALRRLDLSENESLGSIDLPDEMPNLAYLDCSNCALTRIRIPDGFQIVYDGPMPRTMPSLYLQKNKLEEVVFQGGCPELELLDLSGNQLSRFQLPKGFGGLRYLYLQENQLAHIEMSAELPRLQILHLRSNQLAELTLDFLDPFPTLQTAYLAENPLPDALRGFLENDAQENSLDDIRRYFREMSDGTDIDNECKILLIGNGNVGKSCLVERLVRNEFREDWDSTHAISLESYEYAGYRLNLWDFGGQDIYHATHRLFMQSNAIYLLLWDAETEKLAPVSRMEAGKMRPYENFPLSYWLDYALHIGGEKSPIVVVQTKMLKHQKQECPGAIREKYRHRFAILEFEHIDSKEENKTKNGFNKLLATVEQVLVSLNPKKDIPFKYAEMRRYIHQLQAAHQLELDLDLYLEKAADLKIEDPVGVLENWLTKTGVVYFKKGLFKNKIILNQEKAIKAIYTIFDRNGLYYELLQHRKGSFTGTDLQQYWKELTEQEAERELFLSFMLSCEMCFETTPNQEEQYRHVPFAERSFIAPQLLPESRPNAVEILEDGWKNHPAPLLYLRFRHEFLHYGIIQSFIVRTQYLAQVDDIWRRGILLKETGERALIEARDKEIRVTAPASGHELLQKIRNLLHELHDTASVESVSRDGVHFVNLEKLKKRHPDNAWIETEEGILVEAKELALFLNLNEKMSFEKPALEKLNEENHLIEKLDKPMSSQPQIYISYAWGGESEAIVNKIDAALQQRAIAIIRDKRDLRYRGDIKSFMQAIGRGNKVVVVLSKKYLESENCIFELTQIYQNDDFKSRIFPVVLEDANIYSSISRVKYIKYWEAKIAELDEALKSVERGTNLTELQQELNNFHEIRASFDKMAFILKNMNALNPEIHQNENFETLYDALI